jgi:outer membrane protein OmpA-like peptidoglycan-associated protein
MEMISLLGTDRELTTWRAQAVRHYLVDAGIDGNRLDIFAWGGSDMLIDETTSFAGLNDRIEIEIRGNR